MPTSSFPVAPVAGTVVTSTPVSGDGSAGSPVTVSASATFVTPNIGAATGTSVNLSGDATAATFHVGATAGIDASITTATLVGKTVTVSKGLITGFV